MESAGLFLKRNMFNNLVNSARSYLAGGAKNVNAVGNAFFNPLVQGGVGLVRSAQSYLAPKKTIAQAPPPVPQVQPRQLPQQPPPYSSPQQYSYNSSTSNRTAVPTYVAPPPSQAGVPSAEDKIRELQQGLEGKYASTVGARAGELSSFLSSRNPSGFYQEKLTEQGVPDKQKALAGFEKDMLNQQNLLETLPKEDIARRAESGTLTEAARRRIQAMEERPIREQLLKTSQARETEEVGYNRALQLADQALSIYNQETEQGTQVRQAALEAARAEYGEHVDRISQQMTGSSQDREAELRAYEAARDNGYQLNTIQQQQATQLKQQESDHIRTMNIVGSLTKDVASGQTLNSVMGKYLAQGLDPDTILSLYNSYSRYGPAKEDAGTLQSRYGVGGTRFGGEGGALSSLVSQGY